MFSFTIALIVLVAGYFIYGSFVSRFFGADERRSVPSTALNDGVDYVPMPTWKAYMIQFLNIAGLGPVFGAIMGAKFGTASYLWIVFGSIFGGAVHDYFSGMLSLRNNGEGLPSLVGRYLGPGIRSLCSVFTLVLLVLVGCVFVSQPANILSSITPDNMGVEFWMVVIFIYYFVATLFSIDKVIGHIYPVFGAALLFMALGILASLYIHHPDLPELWQGFGVKYENHPIFPMMFVSIACGAVSGFHSTQSPLMARCIRNEKNGRLVFYGAMITEGIVALIWAAAATAYFKNHGAGESAAMIVTNISQTWLGRVGGILTVLGVIAAPISSGDTALRSARLIISDILHFTQKGFANRIVISIPLFSVTLGILYWSFSKPEGFSMIWRYFSWSNQMLSVFAFWAFTVYLCREGKNPLMTLIPAVLMTAVTTTYLMMAPECFALPGYFSYPIGGLVALSFLLLFLRWKYHYKMHFPTQTTFFK